MGYTASRCSWRYFRSDVSQLQRRLFRRPLLVWISHTYRTGKTLCLRIWIKQICTPLISMVRVYHWLDSADEQNHWLKFLLGCFRNELGLPRPVESLAIFSVTVRLSVVESNIFETHNAVCWEVSSHRFSFSTGGERCSGEMSHGAVLAWARGNASMCSCSSYPSDAFCLGLCGAGKCFILTTMFQDFLCGLLILNSGWVFLWGVKSGMLYINIFVTSLSQELLLKLSLCHCLFWIVFFITCYMYMAKFQHYKCVCNRLYQFPSIKASVFTK